MRPKLLATTNYRLLSSNGFTLIEIMIVVSIMGVLMAVAIPSFNSYNSGQVLSQAVRNIRSDLRMVQNFSISGSEGKAWGIRFENASSSYYVFKCTPGTTGGYKKSNTGGCSVGKTQELNPTTRINSTSVDVAFDSVTGAVYKDGSAANGAITIIVSFSDGTSAKQICVSQTGGIREC